MGRVAFDPGLVAVAYNHAACQNALAGRFDRNYLRVCIHTLDLGVLDDFQFLPFVLEKVVVTSTLGKCGLVIAAF
jgi:hypothetical protein